MAKGHRNKDNRSMMPVPSDWREVLQWFVNTYGLYGGSIRGLFLSDWNEEQAVSLEAAVINMKSRGFSPFVVAGETLYQQADMLFEESKNKVSFGRPIAGKLELELSGNEVLIVDGLEAPEKPSHLWYLIYYLLFPRVVAGRATILTTPLSYQEFMRYGQAAADYDFCGRPVNWEKLAWLIESSTINQELFKLAREESLPPMLKAEYYLYMALRDRGLDVIPQHVLGDYLLDFALVKGEQRLNVEVDSLSALCGHEQNTKDARRDFVLLSDGWQILKFSSAEALNNRSACADLVEDIWRDGRKRTQCGRFFSGKAMPQTPELPSDDLQRNAILFGGGPLALVGGAGTGKSTCMALRTAYLLSQGINPENILLLSYSQDSAKQLKRMIDRSVEKTLALSIRVFSWPAFGMKILRETLPLAGRKPPLKVEPSPQKVIQKIIGKLRKEIDPVKLEIAGELDEFYVSAVISMYKSHLITARMARESAESDGEEIIARVYQAYEDHLLKTNRIDKDDVSALTVQLLLNNPELRVKYQTAFEFVLVDEYQELTHAQDMLARLIAAPQDNLFIAGDEDETISESRNACPELLADFSMRFPNGRCMVLEQNWRSNPAIVESSAHLLSYLERRKVRKEFISGWGKSPGQCIFGPEPCLNEKEEAGWIAGQVKALIEAGRSASDIAVLYRQNHYEALLEEEFLKAGIRFHASLSDSSVIPDEVGDMVAFLKLVMDPDGPRARVAFERVCQLGTREIEPKLSATIASFAETNNLSYLKAVEIYAEATADQSCRELEQLVKVIRALNKDGLPPADTIGYLRKSRRLNDYYRNVKIPPGQFYEPLKKLGQLEEEARKFKTFAEFIQHVEERFGDEVQSGEEQAVYIKSCLDVKGFEFPIVFMTGIADGLTPFASAPDMEEERRIFYVAFSRAREAVYLTYPISVGGMGMVPSRFLMEARLLPAGAPQAPSIPLALPPEQVELVSAQSMAAASFSPPELEQAGSQSVDPYVPAERAGGLSPYVENPEPPPSRGMSYLPPSKNTTAASRPQQQPALASAAPLPENLPVPPGPPSQQYEEQTPPKDLPASADAPAGQGFRGDSPAPPAINEGSSANSPPPATVPLCVQCGAALEANAMFCGMCGYSLPERIPSCAVCATALEPNARFCGECGNPVVPAQHSPASMSEDKDNKGLMIKFLKFLEE